MPLHFTGQAGGPFSSPLQMVPGYGSSGLHFAQGFSASMTASASRSDVRTYGFNQVSVALYRAVFRPVALAGRSRYAETVLLDSPIVYYRLDDAGGLAVDGGGSGRAGTLFGGITKGIAGSTADGNLAMSFDGSTGYITLADSVVFDGGNVAQTVEVWLKPSNITSYHMILTKAISNGASNSQFELRANGSTVEVISPGGGVVVSGGLLAIGSWSYVVAVYDGLKWALYFNGALIAGPTTPAAVPTPNTRPVYIGQRDDLVGGQAFAGAIDEVAIYATALNAAQVLAHYNAGLGVIANLISVRRTSV